MRIAYLCKRRYMGKDVIVDRYARLYEIPRQLARAGNEVTAWCLSYHGDEEGEWQHDATPGSLRWISRSLGGVRLLKFPFCAHRLYRQLQRFRPEVLIAASDIPHIAIGAWLADRLRCPLVVDLYDNFEGFGQARVPGMVRLLRRSVSRARLVLTTSDLLREFVERVYHPVGEVVTLSSTIDRSVFHPRDKRLCREELGLPADGLLIGTAGALSRDKGVLALYEAWSLIAGQCPDVHLVLAGPVEAATPLPPGDRVHYLGSLPHAKVAELFCALDVGVICVVDTEFGRYSFPQKAYEMIACGLPVVAADLGAMADVFRDARHSRYRVGDARDLADKLCAQLQAPECATVAVEDWCEVIGSVAARLRDLANQPPPAAGRPEAARAQRTSAGMRGDVDKPAAK